MHVALIKLNGWPETFDERVTEIAQNVDRVTLVRPRPEGGNTPIDDVTNVTVKDVYPRRGKSVNELWLHPILFPFHVLQAILVLTTLSYTHSDPPDVIHSLDYVLGGLAGRIVSIITGIPLVVSVRGLVEPRYKNMVEQNSSLVGQVNYQLLQLIPKFVFSGTEHIITKASYQQEFVESNYGFSIPSSTIPTGVDYDVFDPQIIPESNYPEELTNNEARTDTIIPLFLGRLTEEKGASLLLQNLIELDNCPKNIHILYVGDFRDDDFEEDLRSLATDAPVPVTIHDKRIPYKRVPELISNVDCTVLLSGPKHEGVPRVLQESCVLETKVVASDVEGIANAFDNIDGCYLIDRTAPRELSKAFRNVATSQCHPNREKIRHKFDMAQNYAKYATIYEEVGSK